MTSKKNADKNARLEILIRKTIAYLDFYKDDAAKELAAGWQQVLTQIQQKKKTTTVKDRHRI